MKFNNLKDKRAQDENSQRNLAIIVEDLRNKAKKLEKECNGLRK